MNEILRMPKLYNPDKVRVHFRTLRYHTPYSDIYWRARVQLNDNIYDDDYQYEIFKSKLRSSWIGIPVTGVYLNLDKENNRINLVGVWESWNRAALTWNI